jgi:hypothetical protein
MATVTSTDKSPVGANPIRDIVYLACPYTDPDPAVRQVRFEVATAVAADLVRRGRIVYSPITMTHPIDAMLAGDSNTLGSDYWVAFDEAFMEICSEMVVIKLDGWNDSEGVQREINYFTARKKVITYIAPPEIRRRQK